MKLKSIFLALILFSVSVNSIAHTHHHNDDSTEPIKPLSAQEYILYSALSLICVLFSGLMSGLTVGLLSIDELYLELKLSNGTEEEKMYCKRILAVICHHHLLLVTLLLANALAVEALPLFLDKMVNTEIDIIISITFVLLFGEILPNAILTGENRLKLASGLIPMIKVLLFIFLPLSYPIAKLLDWLLEHSSSNTLKKDDLKSFLSLHEIKEEEHEETSLDKFQIDIMHSVIDMKNAKLKSLISPLKNFVKVSIKEPITEEILRKIASCGYHSILLYNISKADIIGVMMINQLFKICEDESIHGSDIKYVKPVYISDKEKIINAFKMLKDCPIGLVFQEDDSASRVLGVITQEIITNYLLKSSSLSKKKEVENISSALIETLETPKNRGSSMSSYREQLM